MEKDTPQVDAGAIATVATLGAACKRTLPKVAATLLLLLLFIGLFEYATYRWDQDIYLEQERSFLSQTENLVQNETSAVISDLLIFADLANQQNGESERTIAQHLLTLMRYRPTYHQAQFLNRNGKIRLWVKREQGVSQIVETGSASNIPNRYYDFATHQLAPGDVYISNIEPIMEQSAVGRLSRPIIRFSTPVTGANGDKVGVLILDYLAQPLIYKIQSAAESNTGLPLLADALGNWIIGPYGNRTPPATKTAAYMERHKLEATFPELQQAIKTRQKGQLDTAQGIFSFTNFQLANADEARSVWPQVNHIFQPELHLFSQITQPSLHNLSMVHVRHGALIFLAVIALMLPLSLFLVRNCQKNLQAECRIERLQARYRNQMERAADAIFIHDNRGRFIDVNQKVCEYTGYTREELLGMHVWDLEINLAQGEIPPIWEKLRDGRSVNFNGKHRCKNGTTITTEVHIAMIEPENNLIQAIVRDTTKRQYLENLLRESEASFRNLFEQAADTILMINQSGAIVSANHMAARQLGYSQQQLQGMYIWDIDVASNREECLNALFQLTEGESFVLHARYQHKLGPIFPVEIHGRRLPGPDQLTQVVVRDLSERDTMLGVLEDLAKGVGTRTGEDFFKQLVQYINRLLPADMIVVGELLPGADRIRSLAVQDNIGDLESVEYLINGTPCEQVINNKTVIHETGLREAYPYDLAFKKKAIDSYIGVPLHSTDRGVCGVLVILSRQPLENIAFYKSILGIFAARAAAELDRLQTERQLITERSYFQEVIDQVPDPLMVVNQHYQVELLNKAGQVAANRDAERPAPLHCYEISQYCDAPCDDATVTCPMLDVINTEQTLTVSRQYIDNEGCLRTVEIKATPLRDKSGEITGIIESSRDITEQRDLMAMLERRTQELDHLAHHDPLTGLPNRSLFNDRLKQAIAKARRNNTLMALLFLDLDRFKEINDTLGHDVGDAMLKVIASRLNQSVREIDSVARLGGDEFTVILEEVSSTENINRIISKILSSLSQPMEVLGNELQIGASIGTSLYPTDGEDVITLMKHADTAMYRAKKAGRGRAAFFSTAQTTAEST